MFTVIAAAPQPSEGWGKLTGLLVAAAIGWLFVKGHQRWTALNEGRSPETVSGTAGGVKPQVSGSPDPTLTPPQDSSQDNPQDRSAIGGWVAARRASMGRNAAIRAAARRFGVSETTAKRRLRAVEDPKP